MDARDAARLAAGAAGRAALIKFGAGAFATFLICLVFLGVLTGGGASSAYAASCGAPGRPAVTDEGGATSSQRQQQVANARTIDKTAQSGGLPGRATLIGLMAALQESTLINVPRGTSDSLGLFQERPSAGWGTPAQVMSPTYAAHAFFFGVHPAHGRQVPGLVDIPRWETMPLGQAAQAVEVSKFPDLYAGQESEARSIAAEAGIDLNRAGAAGGPDDDSATTGCYAQPVPGKHGAAFHDGAAGWPAVVANPRSTAAAIAWAEEQTEVGSNGWYRRGCLRFVAEAYGWRSSGVAYAIDAYTGMPASMRHDGDRDPPRGALMFWDTGERAGHVALYLGHGLIASNDIKRPGYISVVPATDIETTWHARYVGWSPPYFPKGA